MENTNIKIWKAISGEYVRYSKEKTQVEKRHADIRERLKKESDKLTYREYVNLGAEMRMLCRRIEDLSIQIDIWDKAREICLDIIAQED